MKIQTRLSKSLETLIQAVIPLADGDRIAFLRSLRQWYLLHLGGIHDDSQRGDGLKLLMDSSLDEIPVTEQSIVQARRQLERYRSGDMNWTLAAVDALITDICVLRDWNDCCVNDQFDLEYVIDTDTCTVVKTCTACGYTLDVVGNARERPGNFRIASRSELVAAGVIENAT